MLFRSTYRASHRANVDCKNAIEDAVADHYRDNRLDTSCVNEVIDRFGMERVAFVLANTVQDKDEYGKRISESRYKLAPTASAYTNFLNNLKECEQELREMFDTLVKYMYENLNGFGEIMAADGKAIQSYAGRISKKNSGNKGERDAD